VSRLPAGHEGPLDAVFALERNEWGGAVEPRLLLRHALPPQPGSVDVLGEPEERGYVPAVLAALDDEAALGPPCADASPTVGSRLVRDRRGGGLAGTIAAAVASGEPVLVACADAARRRDAAPRRPAGGFALASWEALEREPALAAPFRHVVALDPPAHLPAARLAAALRQDGTLVLAWGPPEAAFALAVAERDLDLRRAAGRALPGAARRGRTPRRTAARAWKPSCAARGPGRGRPLPPRGCSRCCSSSVSPTWTGRRPPYACCLRPRRDLGDSPAFHAAAERLALARRLLAHDRAAVAA
jgi:hypothetical protein